MDILAEARPLVGLGSPAPLHRIAAMRPGWRPIRQPNASWPRRPARSRNAGLELAAALLMYVFWLDI